MQLQLEVAMSIQSSILASDPARQLKRSVRAIVSAGGLFRKVLLQQILRHYLFLMESLVLLELTASALPPEWTALPTGSGGVGNLPLPPCSSIQHSIFV